MQISLLDIVGTTIATVEPTITVAIAITITIVIGVVITIVVVGGTIESLFQVPQLLDQKYSILKSPINEI